MHTPPGHFATAPMDTGKGFTKPLRSLRALFIQPPSRFATAPEGHGERFPRTPSVASLRIT